MAVTPLLRRKLVRLVIDKGLLPDRNDLHEQCDGVNGTYGSQNVYGEDAVMKHFTCARRQCFVGCSTIITWPDL
jgi:hypothetical protein